MKVAGDDTQRSLVSSSVRINQCSEGFRKSQAELKENQARMGGEA